MADDVKIRDMGWQRAIDRLTAMDRARVDVGITSPADVARYAAVHEHRFHWRTRAELRDRPNIPDRERALQREIVEGTTTYAEALLHFGEPLMMTMRAEILGEYGLRDGRGLFLTGAMHDAVQVRVKAP